MAESESLIQQPSIKWKSIFLDLTRKKKERISSLLKESILPKYDSPNSCADTQTVTNASQIEKQNMPHA